MHSLIFSSNQATSTLKWLLCMHKCIIIAITTVYLYNYVIMIILIIHAGVYVYTYCNHQTLEDNIVTVTLISKPDITSVYSSECYFSVANVFQLGFQV